MRHSIYTFAILLLLAFTSNAQSVTYKTTTDAPDDIKNFQIHLVPFYMEMSRASLISMGWEVWGTADIKKRLRLMTSFRSSYFDMVKGAENPETPPTGQYYTKGKISKSWKFEAMGQFNFADYKKNRYIKVILSQHTTGYGSYSTTHTKYIMVPGTVRKSFGLRGGIYNLFTPLKLSDTKGLNGQSAFYINDKTHQQQGKGDTISMTGISSMNSLVLAAGIDMRKVVNLVINTDSYGGRANRVSSNVYLDVLVAMFNNYRNVFYKGADSITTEYNMKPYGKRPFGWRFGWQFTNPERTGMSMKMEFGKRPEWQSKSASGVFFDFNIGFNIPFRVKKLQ